MNATNFLIGRGELLTFDIKGPKRGGDRTEVYSLEEARARLLPQFAIAASVLDELPSEACPRDYGVASITLNPSYIAKSYFPSTLLRTAGLVSVGSRTVKITPEKWAKKKTPLECSTTEIFVAGKRKAFRALSKLVGALEKDSREAVDLSHIESFSVFSQKDRVKEHGSQKERFFEVGIHLLPDEDSYFIQEKFEELAIQKEVRVHATLSFIVGNLWFVPVEGNRQAVESLSCYSFVRVIRAVPKLRGMRPMQRSNAVQLSCILPSEHPLSTEPRVAILDGGLPKHHLLGPWLRSYRILDPSSHDDIDGLEHGLGVTSAFLFGPLSPGMQAMRPYAYVDHIRVLDKETQREDPLELYRTLGLIEQVLLSRQYEFINLSLGPDLPIEDTDVHAWTSVIDDLLSDGQTFMTVAVGNNGDRDRMSGNARVQVPADCVNAVSVGSANDIEPTWGRATYSAMGPGRSPGVIKPDLLAFGGCPSRKYFHVLTPGKKPLLSPQLGTSFASPYLLRNAVGIRAILGNDLTALAIKALLVHAADHGGYDKFEVGWGKTAENIMDIITCPPGVARVVYQGELKPGKYLRAPLPLPREGLTGRIRLKATFCYASTIDPQDACSYTRAGLEVTFRPHDGKLKAGKNNPNSKSFFELNKYSREEERRSDMGKWETVLHNEVCMLGGSLREPVFDIHYNAREIGGATRNADKIRYALVLTVEAPKHANLYNDILRTYSSILTPIQPQISLPVRV